MQKQKSKQPTFKQPDEKRKERYEKDGKYGVLAPEDENPEDLLEKAYITGRQAEKLKKLNPGDKTYFKIAHQRSLCAHTDWVRPKRAIELLGHLPDNYNQFSSDDMKEVFETIREIHPHPQYVSLGREGSVVVYFWTTSPERVKDKIEIYNPCDELMVFDEDEDGWTWERPEGTEFKLVRAWWD